MALQKQTLTLNFQQGLDTKTDPWQVPIGKFLALNNSIFTKGGLLEKRNGFGSLTSLPNPATYLTTFNGNLTALGTSLQAYSAGNKAWFSKGNIQPVEIEVLPLIRNNFNQSQCDSVIAPNGLVCVVYTENDISSGSPVTNYYYAIEDSVTGQNILVPTLISSTAESPRVFLLGNYFIVLYTTSANLNYVSIAISNPSAPNAPVTLVVNYAAGGTELAFDGAILNNNLYISYNATDGGGAIRSTYLNSFLIRQTTNTGVVIAAAKSATMISVSTDLTNSIVWTFFYLTSGTAGYVVARDAILTSVLAATQVISSGTILNVTSVAKSGVLTAIYEVAHNYSFDASVPSHFVSYLTVSQSGTVSSVLATVRSVGLASKAFLNAAGEPCFLLAYSSPYQPTYFLGEIMSQQIQMIAKLAYQNGGGYLTLGLPSVSTSGSTASVAYLFKDLIQAANKDTNISAGTQVAGIYSQTGINQVTFDLSTDGISTAEIGNNLNITGGFLWSYDGFGPVEQNFFLYPDLTLNADGTYHGLSTATTGGFLIAQQYFYQFTYEWTDQQGNAFRSAPSIPVTITTTGSTSVNTILVPTLRLTYKTNVKISGYRWSTAQQSYYQFTSISAPSISSTTVDTVTIVDTSSDASILGNNLIYTTGGVVEDIGPPAFRAISLFKSRLFGISSEDGSIWYSKQVIQATPVEMSDLFTLYLAPTIGAQGSTGDTECLFPMDDKLVFFKKNGGIYYLLGNGPDNTGANNDFSDFIFITSTLGCHNQRSIVFIPQGLMFQDGTGKGLWLLGRDLSTTYIGAPVEIYNDQTITSAFSIPGTNQVRFTLSNGTFLVYDYFYQQWSTFSNSASSTTLNAVSSCLYEEQQTYINAVGEVFQETPGNYVDGSNPVLMSFTGSWFNLAGLSGYERIYDFYLLGKYYSPHKLIVNVAYDYSPSATQQSLISPNNYSAPYGGDTFWGTSSPWGGAASLEQWRVHTQRQQCQSFQISITEIFDASYSQTPGKGVTLSGVSCRIGIKKAARPIRAANTVG